MKNHVLHVEDDLNDVLLIQRAFRKAGVLAGMQAVHDGDAAVAYLKGEGQYADRERHPLPTLVLLDLKIPRRTGLEVLGWMREQHDLRRLPVAILTSSKHEKDIKRAYDIGANSYLVKPVGFDALLSMVHLIDKYWFQLNEKPS